MVDDIELVLVGRHADDLGPLFVQEVERERRFVNFASVFNAATREQNTNFLFGHKAPFSIQPIIGF